MKPPRSLGLQWTEKAIQRHLEIVSKVLSNISFGSTTSNADGDMNMACYKTTGVSSGAGVEFSVTHTLHHIPIGFLILSVDHPAHIFKSTTAWTAATNSALGRIFLKSDIGATAFTIAIL